LAKSIEKLAIKKDLKIDREDTKLEGGNKYKEGRKKRKRNLNRVR